MRLPTSFVFLCLVPAGLAQEAAPSVENYYPLAVGNTWTYRVFGQEDRFVIRAVREEMVNSQTCVRMEARLRDRVVASEHLALTRDGLCRFREDKEDVEPPVCILKTPGPRPTRWQPRYRIGTRSGTATFRITGTEEVTVPAGKYKAILVQGEIVENGPWIRSRVWYAPGVGPVKQTIEEGKRPMIVLELEKFQPATK